MGTPSAPQTEVDSESSPAGDSVPELAILPSQDPRASREPPMLDVHPPHQPVHSWRDFLVHIATIVVGLLIAVILEQAVEGIHKRHELTETREALQDEQLSNEGLWAANEHDWRRTYVELRNNLTVLQFARLHRGMTQAQLPGVLIWDQYPFRWNHAVWDAAKQKGVDQRMRLDESNAYLGYYNELSAMWQMQLDAWKGINEARQFDLLDADPTHQSPAQLDHVIALTAAALSKHVTLGYAFGLFANDFPKRRHAITWDTINKLRPDAIELDPKGLANAQAKTMARLKAANAGPNQDIIDPAAFQ
jgi:hypothetical protein